MGAAHSKGQGGQGVKDYDKDKEMMVTCFSDNRRAVCHMYKGHLAVGLSGQVMQTKTLSIVLFLASGWHCSSFVGSTPSSLGH